ncbi:MAG: DMT family transporter [Eubacteriaceae bacterium]|jgi:drug/metabolite transporter (DMT)-like permease|nr:DMT family transporter [Eubacteriaceae bacterium]
MNRKVRGNLILLATAFIWGTALIFQKTGMQHVGPVTFNCIRMLIGAVVLLPFIRLGHAQDGDRRTDLPDGKREYKRHMIIAALICGIGMFGGTTLQQIGLVYTTAGKAGFISALYIVIIPLAGLLMHKKIKVSVWVGVIAGAAGLYLLCVKGDFSIGFGDLLMIGSAFAYAVQIITVDHYAEKLNPIMLVILEFTVCVALSIPLILIFEDPQLSEIMQCIPQFLYTGVLSSGAAYTLQVFGQRDTDSVSASLILSSEAVISVIAGALFLGEHMTGRELIGCVLMFAAIITVQLPANKKKEREEENGEGDTETGKPAAL